MQRLLRAGRFAGRLCHSVRILTADHLGHEHPPLCCPSSMAFGSGASVDSSCDAHCAPLI